MNGLMTGQVLTPRPSVPELEARAVVVDPENLTFEVRWPWEPERVDKVVGRDTLLATLRPDLAATGRPLHWWKVFGGPQRGWEGRPTVRATALLKPYKPRKKRLTKSQRMAREAQVLYQGTGDLGIDLVNRADEVAKLLMAGFGKRLYAASYNVDDVLQEVYKGLLVRNAGTCPWDPSKGSFGLYVHRVCGCIVSNFHRKQARVRGVEQTGIREAVRGEGIKSVDVGEARTIEAKPTSEEQGVGLDRAMLDLAVHVKSLGDGDEVVLAVKMIPLVYQGLNYTEIADTLGVRKLDVSKANKVLKAGADGWKNSLGGV